MFMFFLCTLCFVFVLYVFVSVLWILSLVLCVSFTSFCRCPLINPDCVHWMVYLQAPRGKNVLRIKKKIIVFINFIFFIHQLVIQYYLFTLLSYLKLFYFEKWWIRIFFLVIKKKTKTNLTIVREKQWCNKFKCTKID